MARIESLDILLDPTGKAYLAELYGKVIENVQKQTISGALKNIDLSGDPTTGTVEANRYQNSVSKAYKTARTGGKGDSIVAKPVTIPVDQDKEIVEELQSKDVRLYGVDGVLDRRSMNHIMSMVRDLEQAFFLEAALNADVDTAPTGSTVGEQLEAMFVALEKTRNNYVNGVDRSMFDLVLDVTTYSSIRSFLDTNVENANVDTAAEQFRMYHGVRVFSSVYLPDGVKGILMVRGSVAQPVMSQPYGAERIPLSNAFAVELFYSYGTKVVTPDLIHIWKYVLDTPVITIDTDTLSIAEVADAATFIIYDDGVEIDEIDAEESGATTFDLSVITDVGTHPITVVATNPDEAFANSEESNSEDYVVSL